MSGLIPLRLDAYYFTRVNIEANLNYKADDSNDTPVDGECQVKLFQNNKEPRNWQVRLEFKTVKGTKAALYPYNIDIQVIGLYEVAREVEKEKAPFLVRANGAAILYSALREFILTTTGRGPWPAVSIPTTNFLGPGKPLSAGSMETRKVQKRRRKTVKVTARTTDRS